MGQNALRQSDYRIFKSTISYEQNNEKVLLFACWCRFMENRSLLENIGIDVAKNVYGYSLVWALKLAVYQEKMNDINWFFVCSYKFIKAKNYFNNFWVVVKNGRGV